MTVTAMFTFTMMFRNAVGQSNYESLSTQDGRHSAVLDLSVHSVAISFFRVKYVVRVLVSLLLTDVPMDLYTLESFCLL